MGLSPEVLSGLETRLHEHAGFDLPEWVVESRALSRMTALHMTEQAYLSFVNSPGGDAELSALVEAVRVGETRFFRHKPQVDALVEVVVPAFREREIKNPRVWSAGCATGEEAYTLALVLSASLPRGVVPTILATDVSAEALAIAEGATYPASATAEVPEPFRNGFVPCAGGGVRVRTEVAGLVKFRQHNLADAEMPRLLDGVSPSHRTIPNVAAPRPSASPRFGTAQPPNASPRFGTAQPPNASPRGFDLVWCRNVLIYFAPEPRKRVLERLVSALNKGGFLFLGTSESLRDVAGLEPVRFGDHLVWQKVTPMAPRSAVRPPSAAVHTSAQASPPLSEGRFLAPVSEPRGRAASRTVSEPTGLRRPSNRPPERVPAGAMVTQSTGQSGALPPASKRAVFRPADFDANALATEIRARLKGAQLLNLTVDLDGADYLDDDVASVFKRAKTAAEAAGIALVLFATRPGPQRWLRRNGLWEGDK